MKLLVLAQGYPYLGHPTSGPFNERSVAVLHEMCAKVEVLVPRPYAPPLLAALVPRWRVYASIPRYETRLNVPVHRPAYPQFPRVGGSFWTDQAAFWWCRRLATQMHRRVQFDALLAFDVLGVGGVAWRLGRLLRLPAAGWVTGHTQPPSFGTSVARALRNLDIVFYQSRDLLDESAHLLGMEASVLSSGRHIVLPRGIPTPPPLPREAIRQRLRQEWGIADTQTLVMSIGRIDRDKGVFELMQALALATARNPDIRCLLVGANPAFDATVALQKTLDDMPGMRRHVRILPACPADHVWEYLCAADIFAFASRHEGMPNSLLEAMAMGVASVACAIPPVTEIDAGSGALVLVPPRDPAPFAEALLGLAAAPAERERLGALGRSQVLDRFMVRKNTAVALAHLANLVSMKSMGERAVRG